MRGDRLGLIGPNGAGKSTLLKLILGDAGARRGRRPARHPDQRRLLRPAARAARPGRHGGGHRQPGADWVGERRAAPARDQLPRRFPVSRRSARDSPVRMLSGGERNRLLLARLFARPANVLVLDEPTNDLDIETLELLEQTLQDYSGTMLLVSHDRAFLDNVVTQVLAPLGDGRWREYVGGYSDWLRQRPARAHGGGREEPLTPTLSRPGGRGRARGRGGEEDAGEDELQGNAGAGAVAAADRGARSRTARIGRGDERARVPQARVASRCARTRLARRQSSRRSRWRSSGGRNSTPGRTPAAADEPAAECGRRSLSVRRVQCCSHCSCQRSLPVAMRMGRSANCPDFPRLRSR